jgi:hypothetical protein
MIAMEARPRRLRTLSKFLCFNCGGQLIAEEFIVAKISNSGEKAGFSLAF